MRNRQICAMTLVFELRKKEAQQEREVEEKFLLFLFLMHIILLHTKILFLEIKK